MSVNITQISTGSSTIVVVVLGGVPYKRTFADENEANAFTMEISQLDESIPEQFEKAKAMLLNTVLPEYKKIAEEKDKQEILIQGYSKLFMYGIIEDNGSFYMAGGPKISMPKRLVDEFVIRISKNEPVSPLMNFWKLCLLNPDPQARQDLFKFLQKSKMEITPAGLFVSYRSVEKAEEKEQPKIQEEASSTIQKHVDALQEFVNSEYDKLRKAKKGTNVYVWLVKSDNGNEYVWTKTDEQPENMIQLFGVLKELYEKFQNPVTELATIPEPKKVEKFQKVYTDAHTKTMEIRMLQEVRMPREKCDSNHKVDCSYGLHCGTESFVTKGNFGTVGIKVLINPRNVISVPYAASTKMRVCAYFPFEFIEWDSTGHPQTSPNNTFDYAYIDYDMNEMQKQIMELTIEELERQIIIPKEMTIGHFGKLVRDIADDIIKNRVIKIG